ncbi:MAG: diphosphomevalonate decarboxylase [Bdellovibrionales bacterium]|jgi:diphosphomevalonate decarboxylase|nr:diphosphomevalonate decarboxylase [Bdellovibrionales bacterium]
MKTVFFEADAPSNIALIKYMGKTKESGNRPTNASLSLTLSHLRTKVRVGWERGHGIPYLWRPLVSEGFHAPELSTKGQERFLRHAERVLLRLAPREIETQAGQTLVVESANGFPSDCGLASSASSFAALTLAVAKLAGVNAADPIERTRLADLSREGSGSSCRSFFEPWGLWRPEGVEMIEGLPASSEIRHFAFIVDDRKKAVSSSEAHRRVATSLLFRGRPERAEERLRLLIDNLRRARGETEDGVHAWNRAAHLVWSESWEMHALFETAEPPFGYFVGDSVNVLNAIRETTEVFKSSLFREPLVTMDAGPNVHMMLWRSSSVTSISSDEFMAELRKRLPAGVRIFDSV